MDLKEALRGAREAMQVLTEFYRQIAAIVQVMDKPMQEKGWKRMELVQYEDVLLGNPSILSLAYPEEWLTKYPTAAWVQRKFSRSTMRFEKGMKVLAGFHVFSLGEKEYDSDIPEVWVGCLKNVELKKRESKTLAYIMKDILAGGEFFAVNEQPVNGSWVKYDSMTIYQTYQCSMEMARIPLDSIPNEAAVKEKLVDPLLERLLDLSK